ncbi:cysteine-tRNA synthetase (CysRS) [Toxoplasma gondii TgCatPRC2]|uniref:cysteine--tRNA ligase n=1 Tax=Toxoplasma gondii TgCatPRC2 TaxID=1130821 RepID=A0A151H0I8_TOXGO|nr:cysteine-tRNA synthetase (CysRS) [Toxoplasma gondii TgCatPRC2]
MRSPVLPQKSSVLRFLFLGCSLFLLFFSLCPRNRVSAFSLSDAVANCDRHEACSLRSPVAARFVCSRPLRSRPLTWTTRTRFPSSFLFLSPQTSFVRSDSAPKSAFVCMQGSSLLLRFPPRNASNRALRPAKPFALFHRTSCAFFSTHTCCSSAFLSLRNYCSTARNFHVSDSRIFSSSSASAPAGKPRNFRDTNGSSLSPRVQPSFAEKPSLKMATEERNGTACCGPAVGEHWEMPTKEGKLLTGLMVNNSMAGGKVEFVPQKGNRVCWYGCGPTVYDASHMGHARTYVTFDVIRRIMSDYLNYDVTMCMNITDIDDKIIKRSTEQGVDFLTLARHWEKEFFNDMTALNVRLPTVVTRVSEYIPEVVALIERIVKNGYGYESQGSVYFDTQTFRKNEKHVYGRMEPTSVSDEARVLEGEGELGLTSSEKRHPCDFALWKKAKEGEPSWDSPWGKGRPGWHIECSAMADSILPFPLDIHSGGIDLRFPHHDNELAQSEAANDRPQWVNYFLHSGHLHIHGAKMSKSLKNFITIKECLSRFTARQIRLLCLMNRWDSFMNYSPDGETMQQAVDVDRAFDNFFALVKAKLRDATPVSDYAQKWTSDDFALNETLRATKEQVHKAILDNFSTPEALVALQHLMSAANSYLNQKTGEDVKAPLVKEVAKYIFHMLKIFGVVEDDEDNMAYVKSKGSSAAAEEVDGLVQCLGAFREIVRTSASHGMRVVNQDLKRVAASPVGSEVSPSEEEGKGDLLASLSETMRSLLQACDDVRDKKLPELGILLQDRPDGTFVFKRVSKEELQRAKELKEEEERKRRVQREEQQRAAAELQAKKERERQVPAADYFRVLHAELYATFDDQGVPLTLKTGEPVSKTQRQKMLKQMEKHQRVHEQWLASQGHP